MTERLMRLDARLIAVIESASQRVELHTGLDCLAQARIIGGVVAVLIFAQGGLFAFATVAPSSPSWWVWVSRSWAGVLILLGMSHLYRALYSSSQPDDFIRRVCASGFNNPMKYLYDAYLNRVRMVGLSLACIAISPIVPIWAVATVLDTLCRYLDSCNPLPPGARAQWKLKKSQSKSVRSLRPVCDGV